MQQRDQNLSSVMNNPRVGPLSRGAALGHSLALACWLAPSGYVVGLYSIHYHGRGVWFTYCIHESLIHLGLCTITRLLHRYNLLQSTDSASMSALLPPMPLSAGLLSERVLDTTGRERLQQYDFLTRQCNVWIHTFQ